MFISQTVFQPTSGSDWLGGSNTTMGARSEAMAGYAANACDSWWRANCLNTKAGIPWNVDSWDGFNYERLKVIEAMKKGNNAIVNSGDAHGFWLSSIKDKAWSGSDVAVEFAGGSITSQGWGDYFPTAGGPVFGHTLTKNNLGFLELLEDGFVAANTRFGEVASTYKHGALGLHEGLRGASLLHLHGYPKPQH